MDFILDKKQVCNMLIEILKLARLASLRGGWNQKGKKVKKLIDKESWTESLQEFMQGLLEGFEIEVEQMVDKTGEANPSKDLAKIPVRNFN